MSMAPALGRSPRGDPMGTDGSVRKRKREEGGGGSGSGPGADGGEFQWETSKENVMPLKRGRHVPDLNRALRAQDSFLEKLRLDEQARRMEDQIRAYAGDDPLSAWTDYIRWIETNLPEDTRKKFGVLEKCTRALKDLPRYKNDMRYTRLWIQYADLVSNPKDIFKYLYQNKIGEFVSLFYIGWAWVLESMGNYPQAHKIYLKATQKKAAPEELLARKYKEFQRRMSRHWLRVNEEADADADAPAEANARFALENISSFDPAAHVGDTQLQQHRQQLSFSRAERVRRANAHKPVFIVYEDPVDGDADPFDCNIGWSTLDTSQNQNKENDLAPRPWSSGRQTPSALEEPTPQPASSAFEVFVDDECAPSSGMSTDDGLVVTNRSRSLRQRIEGVSTEEEQLAQQPLKNFSGGAGKPSAGSSSSSAQQTRKAKPTSHAKSEVIAYNVQQLKPSGGGELLSFEEVRAQAYERKRKSKQQVASPQRSRTVLVPTGSESTAKPSFSGPTRTSFLAPGSFTAPKEPAPRRPGGFSLTDTKAVGLAAPASKYSELDAAAQEDVTINTRVAMEDINGMFCSPQRPLRPQQVAAEVREDDPVERKLHFSIFEDSVDSMALAAQDQSLRQDANESAANQPFQVFADDEPDALEMASKKPQPRKALQSRDDLVRSVRLTNKDIIMQMQAKTKDDNDDDSKRPPTGGSVVTRNERMMEKVTPEPLRCCTWQTKIQPRTGDQKCSTKEQLQDLKVPSLLIDPYAGDHRKAVIESKSVQGFLRAQGSVVVLHSRKLPRLPLANTMKRQFKKPTVVRLGDALTLEVTGLLGSGGFAYVFAATASTDRGQTVTNVAVKFETQRSTLGWEFYIVNKLRAWCRDGSGTPAIPRPFFHGLHLFSNGSLMLMDKGCNGTLHDLLNLYKKLGKPFPEPLAVYYAIRMLRSIESIHEVNILHGDIKPDNWLLAPGRPDPELVTSGELQVRQRECESGDLCLIDFGRAIDLSAYPPGTRFVGDCHTKGFQCVEMLSSRPWTFQIDTFGFLGTLHCMLFGEYMKVRCQKIRGEPVHWVISKQFKRYWQVDMWSDIFEELLNVRSCSEQPSLAKLRHRLEDYLRFDRRRRQELYDQLAQQERLLAKSKI